MFKNPSVSIIIPVRNEKEHIKICLDSILNQDYAEIEEIFISDGLSDDGTLEILHEYQAKNSKIRLLSNPKRVQTTAFNECVKLAKGEIVARIDAHAYYSREYISRCVKYLLETKAGNVGGPQIPADRDGYIPAIINIVHESPFGIGVAKFRQANYEGFVDSVWPGVFWRRVFDEVGLLREDFVRTEDVEFNQRLRERGYKIYLTPEIKARYYTRESIRGLLLQNFHNGRGIMQTLLFAKKITALRHFIPFMFMSSLLILGILSIFSPLAGWLFILDISSYVAATIFFSLLASIKNGIRYLPMMLILFPALHFSYAIGSVWGIIKYSIELKK